MKLITVLEECFPAEMFNIIFRKEKIGTEFYQIEDIVGGKTRAVFFRYIDNELDNKVHMEINGVMDTANITDLKDKIIKVLNVALNVQKRFDDISKK